MERPQRVGRRSLDQGRSEVVTRTVGQILLNAQVKLRRDDRGMPETQADHLAPDAMMGIKG